MDWILTHLFYIYTPANLKNVSEAKERLLSGEFFYLCNVRIFYSANHSKYGGTPYRFGRKDLTIQWCGYKYWNVRKHRLHFIVDIYNYLFNVVK